MRSGGGPGHNQTRIVRTHTHARTHKPKTANRTGTHRFLLHRRVELQQRLGGTVGRAACSLSVPVAFSGRREAKVLVLEVLLGVWVFVGVWGREFRCVCVMCGVPCTCLPLLLRVAPSIYLCVCVCVCAWVGEVVAETLRQCRQGRLLPVRSCGLCGTEEGEGPHP